MTGWVLFGLTLVVAAALGLALKRRTDGELAAMEERARSQVAELKTEARGRVDRLEREADKSKNDARDAVLRDLMPALDSLLLAREQTPDADVRDGLELVINEFEKALKRHGVASIEPSPGDPFDPAMHEAVETITADDLEPNTIGRLHRQGWRTEDRVLRAAIVGVVKE